MVGHVFQMNVVIYRFLVQTVNVNYVHHIRGVKGGIVRQKLVKMKDHTSAKMGNVMRLALSIKDLHKIESRVIPANVVKGNNFYLMDCVKIVSHSLE